MHKNKQKSSQGHLSKYISTIIAPNIKNSGRTRPIIRPYGHAPYSTQLNQPRSDVF